MVFRTFYSLISSFGAYVLFLNEILVGFFKEGKFLKRSVNHMVFFGYQSVVIVLITMFFVGMAFSSQVLRELSNLGAGDLIGGVVGMAIWRELSPVFVGVVIAGRIGASIASELASMKVTEQVDALTSMSLDPILYLVIPRVFALILMLPLLIGFGDLIGFFAGFCVAVLPGMVNLHSYLGGAFSMLGAADIVYGLLKGVFFAFIIVLVGAYKGLSTKKGAKGVGTATTQSVVLSMVLIFIANFFLSHLFFYD